MDKSHDPHSVYGYDPETGDPREPPRPDPLKCRGCGEEIKPGQEMMVTVTQTRHVITVPAHPQHYSIARANTLEDTSWQRDQSHYSA